MQYGAKSKPNEEKEKENMKKKQLNHFKDGIYINVCMHITLSRAIEVCSTLIECNVEYIRSKCEMKSVSALVLGWFAVSIGK